MKFKLQLEVDVPPDSRDRKYPKELPANEWLEETLRLAQSMRKTYLLNHKAQRDATGLKVLPWFMKLNENEMKRIEEVIKTIKYCD